MLTLLQVHEELVAKHRLKTELPVYPSDEKYAMKSDRPVVLTAAQIAEIAMDLEVLRRRHRREKAKKKVHLNYGAFSKGSGTRPCEEATKKRTKYRMAFRQATAANQIWRQIRQG